MSAMAGGPSGGPMGGAMIGGGGGGASGGNYLLHQFHKRKIFSLFKSVYLHLSMYHLFAL